MRGFPGVELTRRARRRLQVVAMAGILGLSVPAWVPRLLATLPAFRVEEVRVLGTRYAAPHEITALLDLESDASVWDDAGPWEDRVRQHPMVREARVRRAGLHGLEVVVVEKRPVALIATPELRPVLGDGRILPLEPWKADLDLPVIAAEAGVEVEEERVVDPKVLELASLLERLDRGDPEFVSVVSEVRPAEDGGYEFRMLPDADAGRVFLPEHDPLRALRRISLALGRIEDPRVRTADARFEDRVILTREAGR